MLAREEYFEHRAALEAEFLLELERDTMTFLEQVVTQAAPEMHRDFSRSRDLVP